MNSKLFAGLPVTLLFVMGLVIPVSAATVKNEINIKTNTGGNTVNGQTNGANVQTGDTTTSIKIDNQTGTDTSSTSESTSSTKINIESSGEGDKEISINGNSSQLELIHKDGKAYFKTTDANGNTAEKAFDPREEVLFHQWPILPKVFIDIVVKIL